MNEPRSIEVLLFAGASEAADGADRVIVQSHENTTASDLMKQLADQYAALAPLAQRSRLAIDQKYVSPSHVIQPGAEVALIPPVSGG
ncbi:MAG TPA: MoaD/ThiS family protein [Rhodopirellula baltica]|uniref:Molybdopterin synthase sulfur carrier subunit n=1 Tax=Rhodopirellula baltica (strain DSM 10527 / NCIMB 13988 / SH1) TaxID=243090 RepID=Q7URF4_RHOBA|nr:MoaD/ThiS family protein [Rhodopirellula baltica]CAD74386.1 probable molybdopterin converting factor, small subunit [Rhodopirellula baltica SH 1]HBE61332.1 MoaD/ThiS family protein [Rhodopirellula baltica]